MSFRRHGEVAGILMTTLLLVSTMHPTNYTAEATEQSTQEDPGDDVASSPNLDSDRNRILDNLDSEMADQTDDWKRQALVLLTVEPTPEKMLELQDAIGDFTVNSNKENPNDAEGKPWTIVTGFAAVLTKAQIRQLAGRDDVAQIESSVPVTLSMNTARPITGIDLARTDFARPPGELTLTGDIDGVETQYSTQDIVVCVIDSGVNVNHPDLDGGKVIAWFDLTPGLSPTPVDDYGHGTYVAGILGGTGDQDSAFRGVAPGVAIVAIRVLKDESDQTSSETALVRFVNAIELCKTRKDIYGIEVISMSAGIIQQQLGFPEGQCNDGSDALSQAANAAVAAGLVFVAAVGNTGPKRCSIDSPATAPNVIGVGMLGDPQNTEPPCTLNAQGNPADAYEMDYGWYLNYRSGRGSTFVPNIKPDLVAPGTCIRAPDAGFALPGHSHYIAFTGTSAAAPIVSGVVALMLDRNPSLTPAQVKQKLIDTSEDWGPDNVATGPQSYDYGAGRLRAHHAIEAACGTCGDLPGPNVPSHLHAQGQIAQQGTAQNWNAVIAGTGWAIAVTMLRPQDAPDAHDFDISLFDPQGVKIADSVGSEVDASIVTASGRHEQLTWNPAVTGTYRIEVRSQAGTGDYWIDVSGHVTSLTLQ